MSRKTKRKDVRSGILVNGQVVRMDTLESWPEWKRQSAHAFKHAEVKHEPLDLDHTRAHRDELRNPTPPAEG